MAKPSTHDLIEGAAIRFLRQGYEPVDSEPGEWLVLKHPDGREVTIRAAENAIVIEEPLP